MLKIRVILLQTIVIAFLSFVPLPYRASSILDDLPSTEMTMDEQNALWERFSFQKATNSPVGGMISAFDVSEEMGILLLTSENYLLHVSRNGSVLAVYHFDCAGSAGVAWDSSDICLFITRGNIVIKMNCDGELIEILRLSHFDYTTQKEWDELAFRQEKNVKSGTYVIQKSGWLPILNMRGYSKLVFVDSSTGKEYVLYDVSEEIMYQSLAKAFIGIGLLLIIFLIVKDRNKSTRAQGRE